MLKLLVASEEQVQFKFGELKVVVMPANKENVKIFFFHKTQSYDWVNSIFPEVHTRKKLLKFILTTKAEFVQELEKLGGPIATEIARAVLHLVPFVYEGEPGVLGRFSDPTQPVTVILNKEEVTVIPAALPRLMDDQDKALFRHVCRLNGVEPVCSVCRTLTYMEDLLFEDSREVVCIDCILSDLTIDVIRVNNYLVSIRTVNPKWLYRASMR